ncbi:MAG: lipid A biosynthesis acyltransferase [Steroidobacteraceae bacterium]
MSQPPAPTPTPLSRFLGPRYWPVWLGLGFIRVVMRLPFPVILACGRAVGLLAYLVSRREKHIARVNIALCLPELSPKERETLVRRHFEALGCAVFETGLVWWESDARLDRWVRIEGTEHLARALQAGKGAILLSAHFTCLEMGARALTMHTPTSVMYMVPRNPLIAEFARRSRGRHAVKAIASDQVRDILRSLGQNLTVWYAPDQRYTEKMSAIVPFFGQPAATNIATSRLARLSGARVLPYFPERLADGSGYAMRIGAPLGAFPSDDPIADALRFHALIEAHVRRCPEQYLWTYKRFKLPGPQGDVYR